MAYKKTFFQPVRMESQFVASKLQHTIVQDGSNNNIEVLDGTLVTVMPGKFANDAVYSNAYSAASGAGTTVNVPSIQVRVAVPTQNQSATNLGVVDLSAIATKEGQGMTVRDGNMTIGLKNEPGVTSRVRVFEKYDTFAISEANCSAPLVVGQFAVPGANGQFVPTASAPASGAYFTVVEKYTISQGVDANVTSGLGVTAYRLDVARTA